MAMAITQEWTLDDLLRLPDDGNKYELIRGELFVTPPPMTDHEDVIARLAEILIPYVGVNALGRVYFGRSVIRFDGSQVEPDLMVRTSVKGLGNLWERAPIPILVIEVTSRSTRPRDYNQKRDYYVNDVRVGEYWIVDREEQSIHIVARDAADRVVTDEMVWSPRRAESAMRFEVQSLFE